jgi:head-tail adaptor
MGMGAETAGGLRERVELVRQAPGIGAAGEAAQGWQTVAERWARVEPVSRSLLSAVEGETRQTARRWRVVLRSGPAVTLDMRLRWRGVVLRLTGIESDPGDPARLVLLAEELGG